MQLYATRGTADFMKKNGLETSILNWPLEKIEPNVMEYIQNGSIDLVINIPKNYQEEELTNDYMIRRQAVNFGVPLITNIQLAKRFVESIQRKTIADLMIKSWNDYLRYPYVVEVNRLKDLKYEFLN